MRQLIDKEKLKHLKDYERDFKAVIKDFKFKPGNLVLVRNTTIESSLNKKMKPRYMGPMIVVRENKGGSYILAEMTGAVWQQKVVRFRVVPYFARKQIPIPDRIMAMIDLNETELDQIEAQPDKEIPMGRDYLMDDVRMFESDEEEVDKEDNIYE